MSLINSVNTSLQGYKTFAGSMEVKRDQKLESLGLERLLQSQTSDTLNSDPITADVQEIATAFYSFPGWFVSGEQEENPEENLKTLISKGQKIKDRLRNVEQQMEATAREMEEKANDSYYQEAGAQVIRDRMAKYLEVQLELLQNLHDQLGEMQKIAAKNPRGESHDFKPLMRSIEDKIAAWRQVTPQSETWLMLMAQFDQAQSTVQATFSTLDTALGAAASTVEETVVGFQQQVIAAVETLPSLEEMKADVTSQLTALFPRKKDEADHLTPLIEKMKEGKRLTKDETKLLLVELHRAISEQKEFESQKETFTKTLSDFILKKMKQNPKSTKVVVNAVAIVVGGLFGGPVGAFAAKTAADKLLEGFLPDAQLETQAEKIAGGLVEAIGAYLMGGAGAAAMSASTNVFKEVAPQEIQDAASVAAMGYMANRAGFSPLTSLGLGLAGLLAIKNPRLMKVVYQDIQHAWKVCKETPLKVVPKFAVFVKNEVQGYLKGTWKVLKEGKRNEGVVRIAILLFAGMGAAFTLWTLPLSLTLFYVANRAFAPPYEGPATIQNEAFVSYIADRFCSEDSNYPYRLSAILISESNGSLKPLADELIKRGTPK